MDKIHSQAVLSGSILGPTASLLWCVDAALYHSDLLDMLAALTQIFLQCKILSFKFLKSAFFRPAYPFRRFIEELCISASEYAATSYHKKMCQDLFFPFKKNDRLASVMIDSYAGVLNLILIDTLDAPQFTIVIFPC